ADHERFAERFADAARRAAKNGEITTATDRPALDHGNGGLLQDRVGSINAVGDAAKFDNRDGGVFLHTILNAPTSVQRRQREKLFGVVIPSPVGLAMVNDVGPSPLNPSPACDGPFLTKMLALHSRAIRLRFERLSECMTNVCRRGCSSCIAKSMPSSASRTRVTGKIGIICSVQSRG